MHGLRIFNQILLFYPRLMQSTLSEADAICIKFSRKSFMTSVCKIG